MGEKRKGAQVSISVASEASSRRSSSVKMEPPNHNKQRERETEATDEASLAVVSSPLSSEDRQLGGAWRKLTTIMNGQSLIMSLFRAQFSTSRQKSVCACASAAVVQQ